MKIESEEYGTLEWEGELNELTMITVNGKTPQPLSRLIAMTNGEILDAIGDDLPNPE